MKCILVVLMIFGACHCNVYDLWRQVSVSLRDQEMAVQGLVHRILPDNITAQVNLGMSRGAGDVDRVLVNFDRQLQQLTLSATTGVAAAWGINHFLKYRCNCHISWETSQLNLENCAETKGLLLQANDLYRYYQNVCTAGYSFVWWGWNDWEKHVDWMALNGINLPLAFTGQEEIWRRVWTKLGVSQAGLNSHFAGPAFLPWGRMGNIRGWGGPLSTSWNKLQLQLQHRILDRMRSFGMLPVLPGFAGQVPHEMADLYPKSNFSSLIWQHFPSNYSGVYILDPTDPLFIKIGTLFINEQTKEFGTNHIYNCDTFNEMRPPTNSTHYIRKVGESIYRAMATADKSAVWLMQGWLFLDKQFWGKEQMKALLTSVEKGNMLILDLDSTDREQYTRTSSYLQHPYVFNMIHTFGGQLAMFGRTDRINQRPFEARRMENSSLIGTGFTPEGIHNSYVMYDLMGEMSWRSNPIQNIKLWFQNYATRRYGMKNIYASKAWKILSKSVYNSTLPNPRGHVLLIELPDLGMKDMRWYSMTDLYDAWDMMVSAGTDLSESEAYQFDLVDTTRQALANTAPVWYALACEAYYKKDLQLLHEYSLVFLDLLKDLDQILQTNENFMLGPWIESAKSNGMTEEEKLNYEFNARNQITLWGPDGQILDYAGKQWSGLISDYYIPRWELFFKHLETNILEGTMFDADIFKNDFLTRIGKPFCVDVKPYPTKAKGNSLQIAKLLNQKWNEKLLSLNHS